MLHWVGRSGQKMKIYYYVLYSNDFSTSQNHICCLTAPILIPSQMKAKVQIAMMVTIAYIAI